MILLIYPPFAMPDKPYIGLPTLAGYLQKKAIPVSIWDANLAMFQQLMSPEMLAHRLDVYQDRLHALDQNDTIDSAWAEDYFTMALATGIHAVEKHEGFKDIFNDPSLSNRDRLTLFRRYVMLHATANHGDAIYTAENTGYVHYHAPVSFFSSRELTRYARNSESLTRRLLAHQLAQRLAADSEKTMPAMVGLSVSFPEQIAPALTLAAMIRETAPDLPLVLGGAFASVHLKDYHGDALFSLVDYIALGDGECLLEQLYTHLRKKNASQQGVAQIPGLIFHQNGRTVTTKTPEPVPMVRQARPDYTLLPLSDYVFPQRSNATLFQLTRGCYWARCSFCNCRSTLIRSFERPDPQMVYERLKKTLTDTGGRIIHFTDDAADPDTLSYVAQELIREKLEVHWTVNVRADQHLTLERLLLYRKAGCFSLFLGIESFHDRILRLMNKGTTCKGITRCLSNISWSGISANIYMIVGFPTETENEARESFDAALSWLEQGMVRQVVYNMFTLSPSSPMAGHPEAYNISVVHPTLDKDLAPPVNRFECSAGMDRETVKRVYTEFNRRLRGVGSTGVETTLPPSLPWAKAAKFGAKAIQKVLENAADNQ